MTAYTLTTRPKPKDTELKMLKAAGEIKGFNIQPSFVLMNGIRYRPDFIICDKKRNIYVEDVKGFETKEFIIKKNVAAAVSVDGSDHRQRKR